MQQKTMDRRFIDQQILYGSKFQRFIREFVTHSGIFWLFDTITNISVDARAYMVYLPQWVMLAAALIQTWVISRDEQQFRWWYVFIAPSLYTAVDIVIEGYAEFFDESYHIFYWAWAVLMGLSYWMGQRYRAVSVFLRSVLLVILLPAFYLFSEMNSGLVLGSFPDFTDYWLTDSAHFFILFGTLILGVALGIINLMRERFEGLLYRLATHFEEVASWSFDEKLIQDAYADEGKLGLQRVRRYVLFMDIRGFTPWSESHTPQDVVNMVNTFYQTAEPIIQAHNGFKIQMTGDEIMTRFSDATEALQCARLLQVAIAEALNPFDLSAGIGIHCGEVVEGLVGGESTRQYGIFGDTVNTAARLQSQAKANEVVLSNTLWQELDPKTRPQTARQNELTLKGKSETMPVFVLSLDSPQ